VEKQAAIEKGDWVEKVKDVPWDGNFESLNENQRVNFLKLLARWAYPDDPAAAEAALLPASNGEMIEARADPQLANAVVGMPDAPEQRRRSWADITDSEERKRLAAEWTMKGPALPEGFNNKEECVAWLDAHWPID
jgi:hypothetical protein